MTNAAAALHENAEAGLDSLREAMLWSRGHFSFHEVVVPAGTIERAASLMSSWFNDLSMPLLMLTSTDINGIPVVQRLIRGATGGAEGMVITCTPQLLLDEHVHLIHALNLGRDRLSTFISGPLVMVFEEQDLNEFIRQASDLHAIRTQQIHLAEPDLRPHDHVSVDAATELRERQRRVAILREREGDASSDERERFLDPWESEIVGLIGFAQRQVQPVFPGINFEFALGLSEEKLKAVGAEIRSLIAHYREIGEATKNERAVLVAAVLDASVHQGDPSFSVDHLVEVATRLEALEDWTYASRAHGILVDRLAGVDPKSAQALLREKKMPALARALSWDAWCADWHAFVNAAQFVPMSPKEVREVLDSEMMPIAEASKNALAQAGAWVAGAFCSLRAGSPAEALTALHDHAIPAARKTRTPARVADLLLLYAKVLLDHGGDNKLPALESVLDELDELVANVRTSSELVVHRDAIRAQLAREATPNASATHSHVTLR